MSFADDAFDDEDLDDLLLGEDLDALERDAIKSTQIDDALTAWPRTASARPGQTLVATSFADLDDEVLNGTEDDTSREQAGRQSVQYATSIQARPSNNFTHHNFGSRIKVGQGAVTGSRSPALSLADQSDDDLRRRVEELLLERDSLKAAVQDANRQVLSKSGEIAVVRANNQRSLKERDQRILSLEQDLKAAGERHSNDLDLARKQQEQLVTEGRFADHDRVVARARQRKAMPRTGHEQDVVVLRPASKSAVQVSTPRKQHRGVRGDGFDVQERSPARSSPHSKDVAPGAAERKRKRAAASPTQPTDVSEETYADHDFMLSSAAAPAAYEDEETEDADELVLEATQRQEADERFQLLQTFLSRQMEWGGRRNIEILADYRFPSDQETALSTLMYNEIDKISVLTPEGSFAAALGSIVVSLWRRCLTEECYGPITYLLDQLCGLTVSDDAVITALAEDIVPLAQKTGDVNIVPRFKKYRRRNVAATTSSDPSEPSADVSVSSCLDLLLLVAADADGRDADEVIRVWRLVRFDFVSMLLRPSQDPEDVLLMARLLQHGIRPDGFGSVIDSARARSTQEQSNFDQVTSEDHILDRLTSMLVELPRSPESEAELYSDHLVCEMRLALLGTLSCLAANAHAARLIAAHPLAIGRLVRCMADGFHNAMQSSPGPSSALGLHLAIVGEAVRLVYHFVNAHSVDVNAKLAKIHGGPQRYLVVLTRIVFSEDSALYGEGIDEDVVDCAQSLLEDFVSPEEGEMIMDMAEDEE